MLATLALSLIWYFFPYYGAYKWFEGPVSTLEDLGVCALTYDGGNETYAPKQVA